MNQHFIKFGIFYCFLLIGSFTSFAQIDTNTKGVKITLEIPPEIEVEKHDFNDPRATKEVDDSEKEELLNDKIKKLVDEENRRNSQVDGILTPEQLHSKKVAKQRGEIKKEYVKIDKYLGGFSSTSKKVFILCRDFQYPDGDEITIYLNDEPVIRNLVLGSSVQQFVLPLKKGLNVISFKAINQGSSGPNTAAFGIYDENANKISENSWNLATGAKATLSIARVDEE
tara:strand:- start:43 stop:723 length:681 start_codon:yes stop_codon:yes gene_type:complete